MNSEIEELEPSFPDFAEQRIRNRREWHERNWDWRGIGVGIVCLAGIAVLIWGLMGGWL
jgi:hypothetical protein